MLERILILKCRDIKKYPRKCGANKMFSYLYKLRCDNFFGGNIWLRELALR